VCDRDINQSVPVDIHCEGAARLLGASGHRRQRCKREVAVALPELHFKVLTRVARDDIAAAVVVQVDEQREQGSDAAGNHPGGSERAVAIPRRDDQIEFVVHHHVDAAVAVDVAGSQRNRVSRDSGHDRCSERAVTVPESHLQRAAGRGRDEIADPVPVEVGRPLGAANVRRCPEFDSREQWLCCGC
jgi:hypothetical protein